MTILSWAWVGAVNPALASATHRMVSHAFIVCLLGGFIALFQQVIERTDSVRPVQPGRVVDQYGLSAGGIGQPVENQIDQVAVVGHGSLDMGMRPIGSPDGLGGIGIHYGVD